MPENSLDPQEWDSFRATAHKMLEAALDKMQHANQGKVWVAPTEGLKRAFLDKLPVKGIGLSNTQSRIEQLLPYGVGNTHPRFFGWVHERVDRRNRGSVDECQPRWAGPRRDLC